MAIGRSGARNHLSRPFQLIVQIFTVGVAQRLDRSGVCIAVASGEPKDLLLGKL
jgi:hypothetical protein